MTAIPTGLEDDDRVAGRWITPVIRRKNVVFNFSFRHGVHIFHCVAMLIRSGLKPQQIGKGKLPAVFTGQADRLTERASVLIKLDPNAVWR